MQLPQQRRMLRSKILSHIINIQSQSLMVLASQNQSTPV